MSYPFLPASSLVTIFPTVYISSQGWQTLAFATVAMG